MTQRPRGILVQACWFGLVAGFGEVALLGLKKFILGRPIWFGLDIVWLAPGADLLWFTVCGLAIMALVQLWPSHARWITTAVLAFFTLLSWLFMYYPIHPYAKVVLAAGGAAQVARLLGQRHAFHRFVRKSTPWMAAVLVITTMAATTVPGAINRRQVSSLPSPRAGSPNILLVVLDTVRAKNLSVYGYARPTTPTLEKLARTSVVFDRAISTAPWTLPSHASMFTGRWPHELTADLEVPLDARDQTIAEAMRSRGYATAGFVANTTYCGYEFGLSRGFDEYDDYTVTPEEFLIASTLARTIANGSAVRRAVGFYDNVTRKDASMVTDRFLDWLSRTADRPFFAFLNFDDAHEPYLPPTRFAGTFGVTIDRHNELVKQSIRASLRDDWQHRSPEEVQAEMAAYDEAIAFEDSEIGRIVAELQTRGRWQNTIVIITADHGEQFGEHGLFVHGNSLYEPLLHVPLLISYPDGIRQGRRITAVASLRDIAQTVADLTGSGITFPGQSLSRYWLTETPGATGGGSALSEVRKAVWPWSPRLYPVTNGDMASLTTDRYRYVRNGDGREELYALDADPGEQHDVIRDDVHRQALGVLRSELASLVAATHK